jgi:uroporphyrinogen-III synthase
MTVLITRPLEDSIKIQNQLTKSNIPSIIQPMLDLSIFQPDTNIDFNKVNALIFTSKNAVSHIKLYDVLYLKNKLCFAIGPATKKILNDLGFLNTYQADSNIENLISKILSMPELSNKIIYFRGQEIRHNLKQRLQIKGLICSEKICYETMAAHSFSEELLSMANKKEIKAVILYSYNSAKTFFKLSDDYNVANCFKESKIIAMGERLHSELQRSKIKNLVLFKGDISTLPTLIKSHCVI